MLHLDFTGSLSTSSSTVNDAQYILHFARQNIHIHIPTPRGELEFDYLYNKPTNGRMHVKKDSGQQTLRMIKSEAEFGLEDVPCDNEKKCLIHKPS